MRAELRRSHGAGKFSGVRNATSSKPNPKMARNVRTESIRSHRAQISITPAGGEEASHVMSWLLMATLTVRVTTMTEMQASVPRATNARARSEKGPSAAPVC